MVNNIKLWAPWRSGYISKSNKNVKGCVFCRIIKEQKDTSNFIFIRKETCFSVLNIYPYNNGHSLIVPNRHVSDLDKLKSNERIELFDLLDETKTLLSKVLTPQGYNIGMNIGRVSGAGFPKHLHIHIVPRWKGDANFMPTIAGTKVISQSLKELYKTLKKMEHKIKKK